MCISWLLLLSSTLMLEFLGVVICLGWVGIRIGKIFSKEIILIAHIIIHTNNVQTITTNIPLKQQSFKHIFRQTKNIFVTPHKLVCLTKIWWSIYMVHL